MRTAVILVTFNNWELTKNCLTDLAQQIADQEHFVIAVIDNASTDGTVEKIQKNFPAIHLYPCDENLGFGTANNLAIDWLIRDGEIFDSICLLNNDTRLEPDTLPRLQNAWVNAKTLTHTNNHAYAIVAPAIKNKDGSEQPNYFAGLGPDKIGALRFLTNAFRNEKSAAAILQGNLSKTGQPNLLETYWFSGVCWMFGKDLYEALLKKDGFFDEKIFMYYEDGDLALRARKLGARFFICSDIPLTHLGGGSAQNSLSRALQHDRAQQYVFTKHFGIKGLLLSKIFRILRSFVRIVSVIPCIGNPEKRKYLLHHLSLLKAALW